MLPWNILWKIEDRLVEMLLRSPSWHRRVERVHAAIQRMQFGKPMEQMGGTNIDEPKKGTKHFMELFWDELKRGHKPEGRDKLK